MAKLLIFALCAVIALGSEHALARTRQPSPGHAQIPIGPGTPPDAKPGRRPLLSRQSRDIDAIVGGLAKDHRTLGQFRRIHAVNRIAMGGMVFPMSRDSWQKQAR